MKKLRVAVIFGGRSAEHEVSLQSAKNVVAAFDKNKYHITEFLIPKNGKFNFEILKKFDVVFPVLHGTYGEDGTIQGFLKMANKPFVGAGVLGSAIGMDKDVQKRLLRDAGIPVAKFIVCHSGLVYPERSRRDPESISIDSRFRGNDIVYPVFVKPANTGSSVGISKAHNQKELIAAVKDAFKYDTKVLIEETIVGREIECSVLGNEDPIASLPGEVIPTHEFYDYDAKYIDENGARLEIPAKLSRNEISEIKELAIKAYETLCCEGMARVDMFLAPKGKIYINEINTIPGFTAISMYPKLWEASGLSYPKLIDKLIELAMERFEKEKVLSTAKVDLQI